jgi:hypothetical protein
MEAQFPGSLLAALLDLTSNDLEELLLLSKRNRVIIPVGNLKVGLQMKNRPEVLQRNASADGSNVKDRKEESK